LPAAGKDPIDLNSGSALWGLKEICHQGNTPHLRLGGEYSRMIETLLHSEEDHSRVIHALLRSGEDRSRMIETLLRSEEGHSRVIDALLHSGEGRSRMIDAPSSIKEP
jgi:Arc/MetJ-type ribon-helix-helix transcriptional regulator